MDLKLGSPINPSARSPIRNRDVTVTSDLSEVTLTNVVNGRDIHLNEVTQSEVITIDRVDQNLHVDVDEDEVLSDLGDVGMDKPLTDE